MPPGLVELASEQRQQLPFTVRDGADAALCAAPMAAEGQAANAPAVETSPRGKGQPEAGRRHAPAADAVDGSMFRSASTAARGLPSRRSTMLVGGSHNRRAKVRCCVGWRLVVQCKPQVMALPTDRALALAKSGKPGMEEAPSVEADAVKKPRLDADNPDVSTT